MNKHVVIVHEEKNYCDICNASFGQKGNLSKHVTIVHEERKNFNFDICNSEFGHKHKLNKHVVTVHEGYKEFKCDTCNASFGQKGNLNRYVAIVHEEKNNSNVTFVMLILDKRAISTIILQQSIKEINTSNI